MQLKASREAKVLFERNMIRIRILKARLSDNGIEDKERCEIKDKLTRARKRVDETMDRCSNSASTRRQSLVKGD